MKCFFISLFIRAFYPHCFKNAGWKSWIQFCTARQTKPTNETAPQKKKEMLNKAGIDY